MALSLVGTTTPVFGTTSVTPTLPSGTTLGDLVIVSALGKLDTSIPSAPVGWQLFNTFVGGTGTAGAGVGTVRVSQFYQIAPSTPAAPVITIPTSTGIVTGVTMTTIRSSTSGATFDFEAVGGTDTTSATSFAAVSTRRLELATGDLIVAALGSSADVTMTAGTVTSTGSTIGSVVMAAQAGSVTGNDLHVGTVTAAVSSGSGDAAITVNATLSAASYGVSGVIRIRENTGLGPEGIHGLAGWWRADSVTATDGAAIATGAAPNGLPARRGPDLIVHNAAAGAQPIYRATGIGGQPAIEFDGTTDLLWSGVPGAGVVGAITMEVPGVTIFVVSTRTWSTTPALVGQFNVNNGTTTYNRSRTALRYVTGNPSVSGRRLDADTLTRVDQGTLPAASTPYIHTGRIDHTNAVAQGFFDGTSAGAAGTFLTTGRSQNTDPLFVSMGGAAASLTTVADLWQGRIAEVLIYNRDLSSGERAQVHTYLSDRYGITVSDYVSSGSPQTIVGTGLASAEALGSGTVTPGSVTLVGTGIASAAALGSGTVQPGPVTLVGTGIASAAALGSGTVTAGTVTLVGTGLASAAVLGSGAVSAGPVTLVGTGLASGEALGSGTVTAGTVTLTGTGLSSQEQLGSGTVTAGTVALVGTGLPSSEALGSGTVIAGTVTLVGTGIPSAAALGSGTITAAAPGAVTLVGTGLPSSEAIGSGTVTAGPVTLVGAGIATAQALGSGTVTAGPVTLAGTGIPSAEVLGSGVVQPGSVTLVGTGLPSAAALGSGTVIATAPDEYYPHVPVTAVVVPSIGTAVVSDVPPRTAVLVGVGARTAVLSNPVGTAVLTGDGGGTATVEAVGTGGFGEGFGTSFGTGAVGGGVGTAVLTNFIGTAEIQNT